MNPISLYIALCVLTRCPTTSFSVKALPASNQVAKTPIVDEVVELDKSHIEQWSARVTAYTAIETCKDRCIMVSGKQAYYGAAACPRRIPLGTWIDIDGLGVFVCEDRTANWTDGNIDIFLGYEQSDYQQALRFGAQVRTITINHNL